MHDRNSRRVAVFLGVGVLGFGVQLTALWWLMTVGRWPYAAATAAAVELAVLHNFLWHERWTWRDRTSGHQGILARCARFNLSTGATSIAGNLALTATYAALLGLHPVAANTLAVGSIAIINFAVADRWVFRAGAPR